MIRQIRYLGFALIGAGALVLLSYLIPPLRALWPYFRELPFAIQFGLGAAFLGLFVLLFSLLLERIENRDYDESLRDDT